eukprot:746317-Hanusia_phi.AAC.8
MDQELDCGVVSVPTVPEHPPQRSIVQDTIEKIMSKAPDEQIRRLKIKLQRMEEEEVDEVKVKEIVQCMRHLDLNGPPRLIDCLAISYILNEGRILIASKHVEENVDDYWESLVRELGDKVEKIKT